MIYLIQFFENNIEKKQLHHFYKSHYITTSFSNITQLFAFERFIFLKNPLAQWQMIRLMLFVQTVL